MRPQYKTVKRNLIDRRMLHQFSGGNLWHWLAVVAFEWSIIGTTIWICNALHYWWVWGAGIFLIGTRQHALAVLMHEGAHFLVSRLSFWNDLLSNYLTAYPLMLTIEGYRSEHLRHHWYLETPSDPAKFSIEHQPEDWAFPMSKWYFLHMMLRDLTGISQKSSAALLRYLWDIPGGRRPHIIRVVLYHVGFFATFAFMGHPWIYVLLWVVPLFSVTVTCYHIRSIAEHSGLGRQGSRFNRDVIDPLTATRTTTMRLIPQFLLVPYNISYHIEHHLYPSVPVFRLHALHKLLRSNSEYASNAHITRGYLNLFRELTGTSKVKPSNALSSEAVSPNSVAD
jgi:fatty acid desaturase